MHFNLCARWTELGDNRCPGLGAHREVFQNLPVTGSFLQMQTTSIVCQLSGMFVALSLDA